MLDLLCSNSCVYLFKIYFQRTEKSLKLMIEQQLQQQHLQQQQQHVNHVKFLEPKSAQTSAQSSGNSSYNDNGIMCISVTMLT